MKKVSLIKVSLVLSIIVTVIAACLKIVRAETADVWLIFSLLPTAVFIVAAVHEIKSSHRIGKIEKAAWIFSLLFFNVITFFIYKSVRKARIIQKQKYRRLN